MKVDVHIRDGTNFPAARFSEYSCDNGCVRLTRLTGLLGCLGGVHLSTITNIEITISHFSLGLEIEIWRR